MLRAALLSLTLACAHAPASAPPQKIAEETPPIEVAITVDDLPIHGPAHPGVDRRAIARRMIAVFAAHRVPPVYGFVNGDKVDRDLTTEAILRDWLAAGYPLANHTYSHISLNASEPPAYIADLERGEQILRRLQPDSDVWRMFRYPFLFQGDTMAKRAAIREYLRAHAYTIAEVTIDAEDWAYNPPFARCSEQGDAAALTALRANFIKGHLDELQYMRTVTRALTGREIKHVLLLHIGAADADALDDLLTAYERAGVRWIDLPTALADPFYATDPGIAVSAGAALPYLLLRSRGADAPAVPPNPRRGVIQALDDVCR
jgi:peptidoglycan/xylan/chitin deacetylase (PgdA/CDA1 family)